MLNRARKGCYSGGSLRELPDALLRQGFDRSDSLFCVRQQHREDVTFLLQDLRSEAPEGLFDLILCRNVAFTYFEPPLQGEVLDRLGDRLAHPGYLVIGAQERPPHEISCLIPLPGVPEIFRYETALPGLRFGPFQPHSLGGPVGSRRPAPYFSIEYRKKR